MVAVVAGCLLGAAIAISAAVWVIPGASAVDAETRRVAGPVEPQSWITTPSKEASKTPEPDSGLVPVGRSDGRDTSGTHSQDPTSSGEDTARSGDLRSAQGRTYMWHDGDRVLEVVLQSDLVVPPGEVITSTRDIARRSASPGGDPVFRDATGGALMALPGGVLLVLDPQWSPKKVTEFFAGNAISKSAVSELEYATNGFFIDTDAGLESLNLANRLAVLDGVELSSPNWWRETASR
ncbi:MAG: hypothetical protein OXH54_07350 [Acidimicrobiaceae bacterium]|nr:hypothetical protein [Acidimicrobiaceae bacterium]